VLGSDHGPRRHSGHSADATIDVVSALGISTQPLGCVLDLGQSHRLSVTASNGVGTRLYQWYRGSSGDKSDPIAGETNRVLTVVPRARPVTG